MRVALIHNDSAGDTAYSTQDLEQMLRDAGFEVDSFRKSKRKICEAIAQKPGAIVVAGGDGTVSKVAAASFEQGCAAPLFVLPVGTSNNIARTLGAHETIPKLIQALPRARAGRLDIGVVVGSSGREPFVEGAGYGFIGTMLERDGTFRERMSRAGRSATGIFKPSVSNRQRAKRGVARLIRQQDVRHFAVRADDEDLSGDYIAIEVMNTREIGPNVALAPCAAPDDQLLDLLLVRPEDREALSEYVEAGMPTREAPPGTTRRVRHVEFPWPRSAGHIDDRPWANGPSDEDFVRVEIGGAIDVLLP